jgi:hypothetical protein
MTEASTTRRLFLKGGALIAAPIVATGSTAAIAEDGLKGRLSRFEDEAALRRLHHAWLRQVNAGASEAVAKLDAPVSGIVADQDPDAHAIAIAADGQRATGRFACSVEIETELEADCTFAQMARLQGTGVVRTTAARTLSVDYRRTADGWAIVKADLSAA